MDLKEFYLRIKTALRLSYPSNSNKNESGFSNSIPPHLKALQESVDLGSSEVSMATGISDVLSGIFADVLASYINQRLNTGTGRCGELTLDTAWLQISSISDGQIRTFLKLSI